ncbi:MAG: hypothetical protein OEV66_03995 [Spirochaetia bacterium]|nr:hypothetical protein [Spirochaetia bacterium]
MDLPDKTLSDHSGISLDNTASPAGTRPLLVEKNLASEIQADSMLSPMDQVYSPSTHLHGIRYVYRFISSAARAFVANMRTQLPSKNEIVQALQNENYKVGDIDKILNYLTRKSPPHPSFCARYYAALYDNERISLTAVYLGGNENIEKILDRADESSARNIIEKASLSRPWNDRISHGEFLSEKIKSGSIRETYFLGYFKFDETDNTNFAREVFERRILPLLKGRSDILFHEIPLSLRSREPGDEPVLLINDNRDFKFRYQFFSAHLIATAKKILSSENIAVNEEIHALKKSFEKIKKYKSPDTLKELAGSLLSFFNSPNATRQICLEIFLLSPKASEVLLQEMEEKEAQTKMNLDLLLKRIRSRKWLTFIPASFYSGEVFSLAQNTGQVLGVKKSGAELGLKEDYYCMVEHSQIDRLLKNANWFELSILEDILKTSVFGSKDYYQKILYRRKKKIVSLFINPFLYLLRMFFTRGKSFIENTFRREVEGKGSTFSKEMKKCLETSGIKAMETEDSLSAKNKPTEKQIFTRRLIEIMFPDPAPSSLWINEIQYREKLFKLARTLRNDPEFPQYAEKSEEAIIADIQPFLKEELIEDSFEGNLPGGLDHRGQKFTRRNFFPKFIKDQPIVYETIHEELDHELNQYGSKDLVEYYRARSKLFTESNMEKIRTSDQLKKDAEKREKSPHLSDARPPLSPSSVNPLSGNPSRKKTMEKTDRPSADDKPAKEGLFSGLRKSGKKIPVGADSSSRQKIEKTSQIISLEMKEKYVTSRKFSGSGLFPVTPAQMEELLDIEPGTLSMFSGENVQSFTANFQVFKAGRQFYYFPKKFFASNKEKIVQFYENLIKLEESNPLPNREIVHKAQDLVSAIRSR